MHEGGTRFTVRRFAEIDSTNRYLVDEARAGGAEGLVAMADYQTAGRGRLDRRWEAPAGTNLLVSVLLRPVLPIDEFHLCTVAMALAAREACAIVAGLEATLKWPNDVMVGERKLAGILAESVPGPAQPGGAPPGPAQPGGAQPGGAPPGPGQTGPGWAVVVGLGLNVGWPPPDSENDRSDRRNRGDGSDRNDENPVSGNLKNATSIRRETGMAVEPRDLLDVLLGELETRVGELGSPEGRRRLASEYRKVCSTLGRRVTVSLDGERGPTGEGGQNSGSGPTGETVTGSVMDITGEGHLLVDVGACIRTITAGDVVHLRT